MAILSSPWKWSPTLFIRNLKISTLLEQHFYNRLMPIRSSPWEWCLTPRSVLGPEICLFLYKERNNLHMVITRAQLEWCALSFWLCQSLSSLCLKLTGRFQYNSCWLNDTRQYIYPGLAHSPYKKSRRILSTALFPCFAIIWRAGRLSPICGRLQIFFKSGPAACAIDRSGIFCSITAHPKRPCRNEKVERPLGIKGWKFQVSMKHVEIRSNLS